MKSHDDDDHQHLTEKLEPSELTEVELEKLRAGIEQGRFPFYAFNSDWDLWVTWWLKLGGNPEAPIAGPRGWTLLHETCLLNALPTLQRLVAAGASLEREADGRYPIVIAWENVDCGHPECFDDDSAMGANFVTMCGAEFRREAAACLSWIRAQGVRDLPVLIHAVERRDRAAVRALLDAGYPAHLNRRLFGNLVRLSAGEYRDDEILHLLLSHGAKPNLSTIRVISRLVGIDPDAPCSPAEGKLNADWTKVVSTLVEHWTPGAEPDEQDAVHAMIECAGFLSDALLTRLIERGADPFVDHPSGRTPAIAACVTPMWANVLLCPGVVRWVKLTGRDVKQRFHCGWSLLHFALQTGCHDIVELVPEWELNPNEMAPVTASEVMEEPRYLEFHWIAGGQRIDSGRPTPSLEAEQRADGSNPVDDRPMVPLLHLAASSTNWGLVTRLERAGAIRDLAVPIWTFPKAGSAASEPLLFTAADIAFSMGRELTVRWLNRENHSDAGLWAQRDFLREEVERVRQQFLTGEEPSGHHQRPGCRFEPSDVRQNLKCLEIALVQFAVEFNLPPPPADLHLAALRKAAEEFDGGLAEYTRSEDPYSIDNFTAMLSQYASGDPSHDEGKYDQALFASLASLDHWLDQMP